MTLRKEAAFLSETSVTHFHHLVHHSLKLISSEIHDPIPTPQYIFFKIHFNITLLALTLSKVKVFICLSEHRVLQKYGDVDVQLHAFLSSALVGGDWSASGPSRFIRSDRASPCAIGI